MHTPLISDILLQAFTHMRARNPRYSYRAFAKKLGVSSGALSELIGGKRQPSAAMASRLADKLSLDPELRARLLASPTTIGAPAYKSISADTFRLITEWHHFAILSLVETKNFKSDSAWIAQRLGVPRTQAETAVKRLLQIGLLKQTSTKKLVRTHARLTTTDNISSSAIRLAHFNELDMAKLSLESDSLEIRDHTSITMAINPNKLQEAKEKIRKFQDEMATLLETGPRLEVYKLCVQLFPITKAEEK